MQNINTSNIHLNCSCPLCCPQKYGTTIPQPNLFVPYMTLKPPIQYGWVCPRCEGVYSPATAQCFACMPKPQISGTSVSGHITLTSEELKASGITITKISNQDVPGPTCE